MERLRSLNHNESAYVQFQNQTCRTVDIVWINYMGDFQKYITLRPRQCVDIDTFKTHPWIFIDHQTGLQMRVGMRNIFFPSSNNEVMRRLGLNVQDNFPIRIPIPITLPLFTLRQISLQSVFNLLKDLGDIDSLELPQTLKSDVRKFYQNKCKIVSKYQ